MTPVGGERRFAGAVAKRLQSLGALLQGDRRALGAGESLKGFDIDNRWGRDALSRAYDDIMFRTMPMPGVKLPPLPEEEDGGGPAAGVPDVADEPAAAMYSGDAAQYRLMRRLGDALVRVGLIDQTSKPDAWHGLGASLSMRSKDFQKNVPRFLNRLLGLTLTEQQLAFAYFQAVFDAVVAAAKSRGEYDRGIQTMGAPLSLVERRVLHNDRASGAETLALTLKSDLGMPWDDAVAALREAADLAAERGEAVSPDNGFYIDRDIKSWGGTQRPRICLVVAAARDSRGGVQKYRIRRPNNGWLRFELSLSELLQTYKPQRDDARAKEVWDFWYTHTEEGCMHGTSCAKRARGEPCNFGGRKHNVNMVSGAVLPIWKVLHEVTAKSVYGRNAEGKKVAKAQVQRGALTDGTPVIGMTMLPEDHALVLAKLEEIEDLGGIEALAHATYGAGGVWAGADGVWVPADDDADTRAGVWRGGTGDLTALLTTARPGSGSADDGGDDSAGAGGATGSGSASDDEAEEVEGRGGARGRGRGAAAAAAAAGAAAAAPPPAGARAGAPARRRARAAAARRRARAAARGRGRGRATAARRAAAASSSGDDGEAGEAGEAEESDGGGDGGAAVIDLVSSDDAGGASSGAASEEETEEPEASSGASSEEEEEGSEGEATEASEMDTEMSATAAVVALAILLPGAASHGILVYPSSRNWLAYLNGTDWCPHCLNAGGVGATSGQGSLVWPAGRHGICGDPAGQPQVWDTAGEAQVTLREGQELSVDHIITENHAGRIDLALCDVDATSADGCTQLQRLDGRGEYWYQPMLASWSGGDPGYVQPAYFDGKGAWYLLPDIVGPAEGCTGQYSCTQFKGFVTFRTSWRLPDAAPCRRCKLLWHYTTAHNCWPPCAPGNKDEVTCPNGQAYATCGTSPAAYPEEFWNCADVRVVPASEGAAAAAHGARRGGGRRRRDGASPAAPAWEAKVELHTEPFGTPRQVRMSGGSWSVMRVERQRVAPPPADGARRLLCAD
ncbi:FGT1 [Scenedesmus sp. PABB004]|nr:FGT1 [Scenedesmus sp. PABB004]